MNPHGWKLEMNRMLESFANQAEFSLGKISQCFQTLGRPFDDDFRKYYLEMSNQRLDMSFKAVLFSQDSARSNETENITSYPSSSKNQSLNSVKTENDDDLIEICDSDDDSDSDMLLNQNGDNKQNGTSSSHVNGAKPFDGAECSRGNRVSSAAMIEIDDSDEDDEDPKVHTAINSADDHSGINENTGSLEQNLDADLDNGNEVKPFVNEGSNFDSAIEMVDIPLVAFDPNKENSGSKVDNEKGESSKSQQTNTSSNSHRNQSKRNAAKRFKCDKCSLAFEFKYYLKRHQRVHAHEKLLGVKADSNGLYQCTLCVRRFTKVRQLDKHMKSHKDNRYLYYCARCLCEFIQEEKKIRHESQCKGRHYECHLCKVFVTTRKSHMQMHMRTHTGAKPFRCMICDKCFKQKMHLKRHSNRIHSR